MRRIVLTIATMLVLTGGLFAQTTPGGGRRGQRNPGAGIQNALGLSDAQVATIKSLVQNSQTQFQTLQNDIKQKRQTFETIINGASPNPTDVGNAALALHASENARKAAETALLNQVKQQLTADQQQKLDTIIAAGGRGLGFLGLGFGPGGPGGPGQRGRGNRGQ